MPTIPTGQMERELRALYLRWLAGVSYDSKNLTEKLSAFEKTSQDLIERLGGKVASLGALADFPVPKRLDLSPHVGTIYSDMQQAAIQAGIMAGLNSTDVARQMFNLGMDKSFNRLNRLARTETVSAYWKNAWDSISDLPLLVMVWGSEDGPRTCEWCRERDGLVMDSPDLRDHPNGRCTPIPTLRSQVKYRGSVSRDGSLYNDPAWSQAPAARSVSPGKGVRSEGQGSSSPRGAVPAGVRQTRPMTPAAPLADGPTKYSVRMVSTNGDSIYTEMNLDQPTWHASGNTIVESVEYVLSQARLYTVNMDTYEFIPAQLGKIYLRDAGGTDVFTPEEALAILKRNR